MNGVSGKIELRWSVGTVYGADVTLTAEDSVLGGEHAGYDGRERFFLSMPLKGGGTEPVEIPWREGGIDPAPRVEYEAQSSLGPHHSAARIVPSGRSTDRHAEQIYGDRFDFQALSAKGSGDVQVTDGERRELGRIQVDVWR